MCLFNSTRNISSRATTRPDGVTVTKTYDSAGRLSQQIAPTGTKTSSYYPAGASGPGVAPGKLSGIEGPTASPLPNPYDTILRRI